MRTPSLRVDRSNLHLLFCDGVNNISFLIVSVLQSLSPHRSQLTARSFTIQPKSYLFFTLILVAL